MDIKICGLTNAVDANCAVAAGADYLGFVLYAGSPRGISLQTLAGIQRSLDPCCPVVAVMVNPSLADALAAVEFGGADIVQIHGTVTTEAFRDFPYPMWRAVAAGAGKLAPDPSVWPASRYVVDAAVPGQHGGTGVHADWNVAARLARVYPVMLAGGLTPDVVAGAIQAVQPLGVDVSSGIEGAPGRKDHTLMRAFIAAVRAVTA